MLLYSFKNQISTKLVSNRKKSINRKVSKFNFFLKNSFNLNYTKTIINVPNSWQLIILSKLNSKIFYFFSPIYFFQFNLFNHKIFINFDYNTSTLQLTSLYNNNFYKLYINYVKSIFNCFHKPFFLKIKFKGKGYYIFKNKRNTITPQFGYAHRLYIYAYFISVLFLSKTSIFLFGLIKKDVLNVGKSIKLMRSINIFTGRGVRFARQIVYKKAGKVSSYK